MPSTEPSVTAAEFFNGKQPTLNLVSIADGSFVAAAAPAPSATSLPPVSATQVPSVAAVQPTRTYSAAVPSPAAAPTPVANPSPISYSLSETVATPVSSYPERRFANRSDSGDSKVRGIC